MMQNRRIARYGVFVAGGLIAAFVLALVLRVGFRKEAAAEREQTIVVERTLQDGTPCRIVVHCTSVSNGVANGTARLDVFLGTTPVVIPPDCFADIAHLDVPDGVQIADFAGDVFLLLTGGTEPDRWQAKLTIRDGHVAERVLKRGEAEPTVTSYARPWDVHEGRMSSEEMQEYNEDKSSQNAGTRSVNP